ncbi:hypothetical protein C7M84_024881 [Penaeus vannamei]|uniref:Uncharacterized protein n=1 Tax=Penaeus vannamei TaxID=6689 RepID=A0A423TZU4_PENVA|nr:hypothetical protein C7M84_024881 [Penaeus vannamei]
MKRTYHVTRDDTRAKGQGLTPPTKHASFFPRPRAVLYRNSPLVPACVTPPVTQHERLPMRWAGRGEAADYGLQANDHKSYRHFPLLFLSLPLHEPLPRRDLPAPPRVSAPASNFLANLKAFSFFLGDMCDATPRGWILLLCRSFRACETFYLPLSDSVYPSIFPLSPRCVILTVQFFQYLHLCLCLFLFVCLFLSVFLSFCLSVTKFPSLSYLYPCLYHSLSPIFLTLFSLSFFLSPLPLSPCAPFFCPIPVPLSFSLSLFSSPFLSSPFLSSFPPPPPFLSPPFFLFSSPFIPPFPPPFPSPSPSLSFPPPPLPFLPPLIPLSPGHSPRRLHFSLPIKRASAVRSRSCRQATKAVSHDPRKPWNSCVALTRQLGSGRVTWNAALRSLRLGHGVRVHARAHGVYTKRGYTYT